MSTTLGVEFFFLFFFLNLLGHLSCEKTGGSHSRMKAANVIHAGCSAFLSVNLSKMGQLKPERKKKRKENRNLPSEWI